MKVVDPSRKVFRTISLSFVGLWIYAALRPQKKKKKTKENAEKHGKKDCPSNSQFGMRVTPPLYPPVPTERKRKDSEKCVI